MIIRAAAISCLVCSVASAEPAHYTRKQDVHIDAKQTERSKPIRPIATVQRPISAGDAMAIAELQSPIRQEQEGLLVQLVNSTSDDDPDKAEYLFRLAEHYSLAQRFWRLKAGERELLMRADPVTR
jgi:hypothetical protein